MDCENKITEIMQRIDGYFANINPYKGMNIGMKLIELQLKTIEVYNKLNKTNEEDTNICINIIEKRFEKITKNNGSTALHE